MSHTAYNQATGAMMDTTGIEVESLEITEEITMETVGNKLKVTNKTPRARALTTLTSSSNVLKVVRYLPLSN